MLVVSIGKPGVNKTVSLLCISQGGPGNVFTWSTAPDENSEFVYDFDHNIVVNGDELTIMNARFYVDTVFRCEVTNLAGSGSNVITITSMK